MAKLKKLGISLAVATVLGFNGCGSGSSDDDSSLDTIVTKSGKFIDSPVSGIQYSTPTQSGITDENGSFNYKDGETVTFKIGGIQLGSTKADNVITPQEIVGVTVVENSKAQDMLVLLQTLDANHNASDGIEIDEATRSLSASMSMNFIEDTFDINLIITQFSIDESYKVSDTDAMTHFQETLKAEYPSKGLKFTNDIVKNKSFYKIFVKEDKTTVIYVKVTFNESDITFTYGTKDDFINARTGNNTGSYEIKSNGTLIIDNDVWELLKLENDKMIILNTTNTDDDGNAREERKAVEKWLSQKPVGFP